MLMYSRRMGQASRRKVEKVLWMPNHHGLAGCLVTVVTRRRRMARKRGMNMAG